MADDIMPEEAARRRRAGELRRLGMRYPVTPTPIDEAIERQRAASREFMRQQLAAERALVRSGERLPVPASGGGGAMLPPTGRDLVVPGSDRPLSAGEQSEGRAVSNRSRMTINPTVPQAGRSLLRRALGPAAVAVDIADPNPVADATLRGNPSAGIPAYGGTRFNDEPVVSSIPDVVVTAPAAEIDAVANRNRRPTNTRSNQRMRPREATADELNQRELDRIASIRGVLEGGDIQPAEEQSSLDRALGRIGLRRTNETGEGRPSTGNFREDVRELGRTLGLKKGGKVKKMASGGVVKSSASRRGDGIAARGKTKGRMV